MKNFLWFICRQLAKFNRWIDNLSESARLGIGLIVGLGPWFVLDILAMVSGQTVLSATGMIWVALLIFLRIWWKHGNLEKFLIKKSEG